MGPQLFSYGNYGNKDYLDIDNNASMGPQLFSYGYFIKASTFFVNILMLQWGHNFSVMDTALYIFTKRFSSAYLFYYILLL